MLQDIAPKKLDNAYLPDAVPADDSVVFCFRRQGRMLELLSGTREERLCFPTWGELAGCLHDPSLVTYLFRIDGTAYFLLQEEAGKELVIPGETEGFDARQYSYSTVRAMRQEKKGTKEQVFAAVTAAHLAGWYYDNRFCGTCGNPTQHSAYERAMECPACGRKIYPRLQPAVIVGVTDGDRIVLTRYAGRHVKHYALIAGFTEIGETLEETVEREVMEEVGLRVKNIRYYKSQPWGFEDDILAGFYCDVDGDRTIRMDKNELKEAAWFTREEVQLQEPDFSLTGEMMLRFQEGKEI